MNYKKKKIDVAGGATHEFKNNKYKFETGLHYLGFENLF